MNEIDSKLKLLIESDDRTNWKLACEIVKGFNFDTKMYLRSLFVRKSTELYIAHMKREREHALIMSVVFGFRDPTIPYLEELNEYVIDKLMDNDEQRTKK